MDLWIRRDAERKVAAGAAVIAALLPWDVTYLADIAGGTLVYFRFPFVEFQWAMGIQSLPAVQLRLAHSAATLHAGGPLEPAYQAYVAGAIAVVLALLLSLGLVVAAPREGGVNPTQVVGGILVVAGLLFVGGWVILVTAGAGGIDVPFGAVLLPTLGGVLVLAERR